MPDIPGTDHVEFFVVPTTKAAELVSLGAEIATLAATRRAGDDDELSGNEVDDLLFKLERLSTGSAPHEITVHPQGDPASAHFTTKYGLLDPAAEYDPSGYLGRCTPEGSSSAASRCCS